MRKRCSKCKDWKLRLEFYANKRNKDGLDCWCKDCRNKQTKQWRRDNRGQCKRYTSQEQDTIYKARHRAKHRVRYYARYQLQKARENGLHLDRCVWPGCTETENIEGHHPDYHFPFLVSPLCPANKHHKAADLVGDKLGFDLPTIDISVYLKSKSVKPGKAKSGVLYCR